MNEIKLVIADVDGTLLTSKKKLTSRALKAIRKLKERGIFFVITSGRPPKGLARLARELDLQVPIAAFNGGMFIDPRALPEIKVISQKVIPESLVRGVFERVVTLGHDVWLYRNDQWLILKGMSAHVKKEQQTVHFSPNRLKNYEGQWDHVVKLVAVSDDYDALARTEKQLQAEFKGRLSVNRSQPYYLDISHPEANKGEVVKFFEKYFAVHKQQVATLGDMPNDVQMFKGSALSIAMGNADAQVKHQASAVTDSNECEGFAKAIEKLILPKVA
jgi:Cof subfamily protein (haloacid dehalogenase superfamily)